MRFLDALRRWPTITLNSIDGIAVVLSCLFIALNHAYISMLQQDEYFSEDADGNLAFVCNHQERWVFCEISLSNLIRAEFRGLTGTVCELRFLRSLLESAADLEKVIVRFSVNNYNIDGWVDYFLNMVLEDHSYEWRP